jgi:membrane protein YqaA with SNARE-associated domain
MVTGRPGEGVVAVVVVATFVWCLVSAVLPVVNAEVYLVGVSVATGAPEWLLALAAAAGQVTGKMLFYLVGRGVLDVQRLRRKGTTTGRWAEWVASAQEWASRHSWGPAALAFASALGGLPPFAAVSLLAGTLRMRWWVFALVGLAGRYLRFLLVLLAPHLLPGGLLPGGLLPGGVLPGGVLGR